MNSEINPFEQIPVNPFEQIPPFLPTTAVVQASGSCFNPSTKDPRDGEQGTLGARVSLIPDARYTFIATAHTFKNPTFQWLYNPGTGGVQVGQTGTVIKIEERIGPHTPAGEIPIVDCALIRLNTMMPKDIASGVLQGPKQRPIVIKGQGVAAPDMFVTMFGVMSGLTYGKVTPPIDLLKPETKAYDKYLFFIQLCNEQGLPLEGEFSQGGDSGAMIMDEFGYVLGMILGSLAYGSPGNRVGVAMRFAEIEAALGVKLNRDA